MLRLASSLAVGGASVEPVRLPPSAPSRREAAVGHPVVGEIRLDGAVARRVEGEVAPGPRAGRVESPLPARRSPTGGSAEDDSGHEPMSPHRWQGWKDDRSRAQFETHLKHEPDEGPQPY